MRKFLKKRYGFIIFILFYSGFFFFYNYNKILTYRPKSIHQHRQCDCLSFTYNFYKTGNSLFEPQLNLKTGKNFSGKNASEFPILYWTVAKLWKLFGYHEWIYRLFFVIIMFLGLFALFRIFENILKDVYWAILLPLWLFTSTIIIYYGNNFLTDVPGLCFAFIGWYFFLKYVNTKKYWFIIATLSFFCLAMLVKITAGISFAALLIIFILEWTKIIRFDSNYIFKKRILTLLLFLFVGIIVASWYLYAVYYNKVHENYLFQTGVLPIWNMKSSEITIMFRILFDFQLKNYFHTIGLIIILAFFVIALLNFKKQNRFLLILNIIIFLCCIGGMSLWFGAYNVHDYHLINYLIFIPATCLTFFNFLKQNYPDIFSSLKFKIVMLVIVLVCAHYGKEKTWARYCGHNKQLYDYSSFLSRWEVDFYRYENWAYGTRMEAYETITPYLREIGITENDNVFSLPDASPSITLYLMGQNGVSFIAEKGPDFIHMINHYKSLNIKYAIVGDTSIRKDPMIAKVLSEKIGQYKNVAIYKISYDYKLNSTTFFCDSETTDSAGINFIGNPDSIKFAVADSRSEEKALSGKYSVCLIDYKQYGFVTTLPFVTKNQYFVISVWRYCEQDTEAGICLSAKNSEEFYNFSTDVTEENDTGWEKIRLVVTIPKNMDGKEVSLYVYNPDKNKKVFFDDFEVSILNFQE
ncbi:MAG: glycosyltransferase family 39 protein [Bacteroidales bacterium]|nr:glycosyltransferase family 39 protein [Bacteroidales bacterium]MDD4213736.1 glycosyltransferase family 39 protein [Bacteroidales bacterium]